METNLLEIIEMIRCLGNARAAYLEAIQEMKLSDYDKCNELIKKGNEMYANGHRIHQQLIQKEAEGESVEMSVLLTHAQDQLISAECFKILCDEFLSIYKRLDDLNSK